MKLHVAVGDEAWVGADWPGERACLPEEELGREWEWEVTPEVSFRIVDALGEAIELFNRHAPCLAASLIADWIGARF